MAVYMHSCIEECYGTGAMLKVEPPVDFAAALEVDGRLDDVSITP